MTCAGARGDTAAQIAKVLHFDLRPPAPRAFGGLTDGLNAAGKANDFELRVADDLWSRKATCCCPDSST